MNYTTKTLKVSGEEITVKIPVGSMDPPSEASVRIMKASQNPVNWKLPTSPFHTYDKSEAEDLAYCYDWYFGGHELTVVCPEARRPGGRTLYRVTSKGYYHYVGA